MMIEFVSARGRHWLPGLLLAALFGCSQPEVELADGSGRQWQDWQGNWLVINYWAEWCAPCREEIPELNRLHREGADAGVVVLGVNFDRLRGEPLTRLMRQMDIRFPVLLEDPAARWDQSAPNVLPSTLVIDPQGNLADVLVGPQSFESLARAVELTTEV